MQCTEVTTLNCPRTLTHLFNLFILFPLVTTVLTLPLSASAKPFWAVQVPVPWLFCWPHSGPGQHQVPRRPQNMVFSVIQATIPLPPAWNYLYVTPVCFETVKPSSFQGPFPHFTSSHPPLSGCYHIYLHMLLPHPQGDQECSSNQSIQCFVDSP